MPSRPPAVPRPSWPGRCVDEPRPGPGRRDGDVPPQVRRAGARSSRRWSSPCGPTRRSTPSKPGSGGMHRHLPVLLRRQSEWPEHAGRVASVVSPSRADHRPGCAESRSDALDHAAVLRGDLGPLEVRRAPRRGNAARRYPALAAAERGRGTLAGVERHRGRDTRASSGSSTCRHQQTNRRPSRTSARPSRRHWR